MPVKHILLPMLGGDTEAAPFALELAQATSAHVTGGFFEASDPNFYAFDREATLAAYATVHRIMRRIRDERAAAAHTSFEKAVELAKVPIVAERSCGRSTASWI